MRVIEMVIAATSSAEVGSLCLHTNGQMNGLFVPFLSPFGDTLLNH
jgi:hypothetical protein